MKILVLNGSPKGSRSNTLQITEAFMEGLKSEWNDATFQVVDVYASQIEHCKGCFGCWTVTPGKCVIHDDMDELLPQMIDADLIVWSFPLYYYGMPSKLKALLDRNLPLNLPFMTEREEGGCNHPRRYEHQPMNVLISTCGFSSLKNNYEALIKQFELIFGKDFTSILCPEGELFAYKELRGRTDSYLAHVRQAGKEYALSQSISEETREKLSELLYEPEAFKLMADASWNIQDDMNEPAGQAHEKTAAERFTKQMAAMYNRKSFDGNEKVFEIKYTDVDEAYQLVLGKDRCEVRLDHFTAYTTRVETPLSVWQDIARGNCNGEEAMMAGLYRSFGDLKLLMAWNHYFGIDDEKVEGRKKTNMLLLILPWTMLWTLLPLHPLIGGAVCLCILSASHFAHLKWTLTMYDSLSYFFISVFSILALSGLQLQLLLPLSYLCFGLMWLFSCFTRYPLSAYYSKEDYHGDSALNSRLFIKTNLILSACWGGLYLLTPIWTYFIMGSRFSSLIIIINSLCPLFLGMFTVWFAKWYPSQTAAGQKLSHPFS